MTTAQWAPNHDNEAGYVTILANTAGDSAALITPIKYPAVVIGGDRSAKTKGDPYVDIDMINVDFSVYTTMRETTLGFSSSESEISKDITIALLATDQSTYNNYNATVYHITGDDAVVDDSGMFYARVHWRVVIVGTT